MEEEDGFHATMRCTKAVALWSRLREIWDLPKENTLTNSGKEWALHALSRLNSNMRIKVMLIWWRVWHLRNNIIFGDGKCGIKNSVEFLRNYLLTLTDIKDGREDVDVKGKKPVSELILTKEKKHHFVKPSKWIPPDTGWQCMNVDASYVQNTREASWGAIIRDAQGQVISTAWALIQNCANTEAAEAMACWEGYKTCSNGDQFKAGRGI
uniref:Uncharacterized protein n=1 Tax=Avena sativa TaxID=4498 RepID=A0ACD5VSP2_AVESA